MVKRNLRKQDRVVPCSEVICRLYTETLNTMHIRIHFPLQSYWFPHCLSYWSLSLPLSASLNKVMLFIVEIDNKCKICSRMFMNLDLFKIMCLFSSVSNTTFKIKANLNLFMNMRLDFSLPSTKIKYNQTCFCFSLPIPPQQPMQLPLPFPGDTVPRLICSLPLYILRVTFILHNLCSSHTHMMNFLSWFCSQCDQSSSSFFRSLRQPIWGHFCWSRGLLDLPELLRNTTDTHTESARMST